MLNVTDSCCSHVAQDQGVPDYEKQARLSRFQGSQAISSSDYFGREDGPHGGGANGGGGANSADFDVTAGELMNKLSFQASHPAVIMPPAYRMLYRERHQLDCQLTAC